MPVSGKKKRRGGGCCGEEGLQPHITFKVIGRAENGAGKTDSNMFYRPPRDSLPVQNYNCDLISIFTHKKKDEDRRRLGKRGRKDDCVKSCLGHNTLYAE